MARRRSAGEGSIYKRSDGLWVAEITLPDGKRKRKHSKTQSVVRQWLQTSLEALRHGSLVVDDNYTVSAFLDRWYADVASRTLRPKTLELYESMIRLHIKPDIGSIRLTKLRPDQLQSLYNKKLDSGLSKRSVECIHAVIHKSLDTALKWGLVSRNVSDATDPPRPDKKQVVPLTSEQVSAFIRANRDDRLYPLWLILIGCGLRRGEALGLKRADIDLHAKVIHVRRNLQWIAKKGFILGEPKSEKGVRDVGIPEFVMPPLISFLQGKNEDDFVFTTRNGTPFIPRNVVGYFKEALERAGLPQSVRIHDLRHTWVSHLIQSVPIKDVQTLAGHSTIAVTLDIYGAMLPGAMEKAAEKANDIFKVGE